MFVDLWVSISCGPLRPHKIEFASDLRESLLVLMYLLQNWLFIETQFNYVSTNGVKMLVQMFSAVGFCFCLFFCKEEVCENKLCNISDHVGRGY